MIGRYSRPEMAAVWTEEAKLGRWLDVELAVCRAWARRGVIPAGDLAEIEARAGFSVARSQELERTINHDVVAFLTDVAEHIGPASRWVHYGMTSSDVLDTGLALAIARAGAQLLDAQAALTGTLRELALAHRDTVAVGRTHGVHAEPTTFGWKLAGHAFESRRNEERLRRAVEGCAVGTLSGAVGTYAALDPALEAEVLEELGLRPEPAPTQVVARDRHAEPTTFGWKLAGHAFESRRNEERLRRAVAGCAVGTLSGAVGTYAALDPALEAEVLEELGLRPEPAPTQVVARDRHAELLTAIAIAGSSLDRLATELRHLQRTELREAEEAFTAGQKGSSAMPHKRNPITAERISGLSRVLRGYAVAGLEDVPLWHERDISHSSVERVVLPDATLALDYMLAKARGLLEGLVVRPERMRAVLDGSHGLVFSQRVLLGLVERGLTREDAYALVQRAAMRAWDESRPLGELLREEPGVTERLDEAALGELLDPSWHLRHMDELMERVAAL